MKKLAMLVLVIVLAKVGYDQFMRGAEKRQAAKLDEFMAALVAEMNGKLPLAMPLGTVTKVEYADQALQFTGDLKPGTTDAMKTQMIQTARATYCGSKELVRRKVGVVYNLRGQPRSFEDLTRVGGWQVAFGPQDCA